MVTYLLDHGSSIKEQDGEKKNSLLYAAQGGHLELLQLFLTLGCLSIDDSDVNGMSSLLFAAQGGYLQCIQFLLANGFCTTEINIKGMDSLHLASRGGHTECVSYLLGLGCSATRKSDINERTSLLFAAQRGHLVVVKLLLSHGSDIEEIEANTRRSSITLAAKEGHFEIVRFLLEKGGRFCEKDSYDMNALHYTVHRGNLEILQAMQELGGDITENSADMTCLLIASKAGRSDVVQYLLQQGSDTEEKDKNGNTSIHLALRGNHSEVAMHLLDYGCEIDASALKLMPSPPSSAVLEILVSYANISIEEISRYVSEEDFSAFMKEMQQKKTNKRPAH